jgi:hypothetical protein
MLLSLSLLFCSGSDDRDGSDGSNDNDGRDDSNGSDGNDGRDGSKERRFNTAVRNSSEEIDQAMGKCRRGN